MPSGASCQSLDAWIARVMAAVGVRYAKEPPCKACLSFSYRAPDDAITTCNHIKLVKSHAMAGRQLTHENMKLTGYSCSGRDTVTPE